MVILHYMQLIHYAFCRTRLFGYAAIVIYAPECEEYNNKVTPRSLLQFPHLGQRLLRTACLDRER